MMPSWCRQVNWGNCGIPSELRSSLCERRLERTVLRPALLPAKTAQFTQSFRQVWRHTVKSFSLTESVWGALHSQSFDSFKKSGNRIYDLLGYKASSIRSSVPKKYNEKDTIIFALFRYRFPSVACPLAETSVIDDVYSRVFFGVLKWIWRTRGTNVRFSLILFLKIA